MPSHDCSSSGQELDREYGPSVVDRREYVNVCDVERIYISYEGPSEVSHKGS
jgi:hypothetical protein